MITVTVKRGAGLHCAEPITEALVAGSLAAATARANTELDANGSQRERVSVEIVPLTGLAANQLVSVVEIGRPEWRGLIDSVRLEITAANDDAGRMTLARNMIVEIEKEA